MHSKKWSARSPVAGLSCFYCSESVSFPLLAIFSSLSPPQGADEGHLGGGGDTAIPSRCMAPEGTLQPLPL